MFAAMISGKAGDQHHLKVWVSPAGVSTCTYFTLCSTFPWPIHFCCNVTWHARSVHACLLQVRAKTEHSNYFLSPYFTEECVFLRIHDCILLCAVQSVTNGFPTLDNAQTISYSIL
jgi:hypothetical protein